MCGSFTAKKRRELVDELAPLREDALDDHPWQEWADMMAQPRAGRPHAGLAVALERPEGPVVGAAAPERVCEVEFTQLTNGRFRHNAHFLRWRPDRDAASCRYDQLEVAAPAELGDVLG